MLPVQDGLEAWYDFVKGDNASVLIDRSPNGHHGTLPPSGVEWLSSGGLRFYGTSYVTLPGSINLRDAFSIIIVLSAAVTMDNWANAIRKEHPTRQFSLGLSCNGDRNPLLAVSENGVDHIIRESSIGAIPPDEPLYLGAYYDGDSGVLELSYGFDDANGNFYGTVPKVLAESDSPIELGYLFTGNIYYVLLYGRNLTPQERRDTISLLKASKNTVSMQGTDSLITVTGRESKIDIREVVLE
jgi:hypothetical protein